MILLITMLIIWAVLATASVVFLYLRNQQKWKTADRLLDDLLANRQIDVSDLDEGELSLFANRMIRIQDKLNIEISKAEDEKEQVKQLISNMSHQLKTPIANVMMYTQLLENEELSPEDRTVFLDKLKLHSGRIDWILNSLFKMTKLEQNVISFDTQNCSIRETIRQAVSAVYEKADAKNIEIITENFQDLSLWHNRKWTAEVFENLLENAVKYTEANGQITISVQIFEMYSSITIQDNGIGIKAEELSKIFHRFYRSMEVQNIEGSGIGLYLSKIILEKEKGYLTVDSEYGKGSSFSVFLRNA